MTHPHDHIVDAHRAAHHDAARHWDGAHPDGDRPTRAEAERDLAESRADSQHEDGPLVRALRARDGRGEG